MFSLLNLRALSAGALVFASPACWYFCSNRDISRKPETSNFYFHSVPENFQETLNKLHERMSRKSVTLSLSSGSNANTTFLFSKNEESTFINWGIWKFDEDKNKFDIPNQTKDGKSYIVKILTSSKGSSDCFCTFKEDASSVSKEDESKLQSQYNEALNRLKSQYSSTCTGSIEGLQVS